MDHSPLDLCAIDIPVMIVASRKDKLVEYDSAIDIIKHIPHAIVIEPDCGHIGMIAGGQCVDQVWRPIADWMKFQASPKQA